MHRTGNRPFALSPYQRVKKNQSRQWQGPRKEGGAEQKLVKYSSNNGSLTIGHSGITKITGAANGNADELILIGANASANVGMSIISNNANQGIIYFGDEDDLFY